MSILNIQLSQAGLVGVTPNPIYINTDDTYAEVTATGYLNGAYQLGEAFSDSQMALVQTTDDGPVWLKVAVSGSDYSLEAASVPGSVTTPTVVNNLIVSTDTDGTLANLTGEAIHLGNLNLGEAGTQGSLVTYPTTAASGIFVFGATDSAGAYEVAVTNASHAQSSVYSIPDGGQAAANFIVSESAGTQAISSGSVRVSAGLVISGISAGGFQGVMRTYPNTTANGYLDVRANDNSAGDFHTVLTTAASVGQAQVISIPDSGSATANVAVAPSALVVDNVLTARSTDGSIQDGGFAVLANTTAAYGGGGTSNAYTATGIGATSIVTATILAQTNTASIVSAVPSADTLTVTFSADPGAATTVSWIAITPAV